MFGDIGDAFVLLYKFLVGLVVILLIVLVASILSCNSKENYEDLIASCEQELKRNHKCKLIAVPDDE